MLQATASYWAQSQGFIYRGSPALDRAMANAVFRPWRFFQIWGAVARNVSGDHAFAPDGAARSSNDNESVQASLVTRSFVPVLENVIVGFNRSHSESWNRTVATVSPRYRTEKVSLRSALSSRLPDEMGRIVTSLVWSGHNSDSGGSGGIYGGDEVKADASWSNYYGPFRILFAGGLGVGNSNRAGIPVGLENYRLRHELAVTFDWLMAVLAVQYRREMTNQDPNLGTGSSTAYMAAAGSGRMDLFDGSLSMVVRPNQAHEFRADAYLNNVFLGQSPRTIMVWSDPMARSTNLNFMVSYAFYFGDAVAAPSVLDWFSGQGVRVIAFSDQNENGTRDTGEPPVAEISVQLDDGDRVYTDNDGVAEFNRIRPGPHRVVADINGASLGREGLRFTTASTIEASVDEGEVETVYVGLSDRVRVTGALFNDANLDGQRQQPGEPGIPGVAVTLQQGGRTVGTATTDGTGAYTFALVAPGAYALTVDPLKLPGNYQLQETEVSLEVAAGQIARAMLPAVAFRTVEGRVFVDKNENGKFDDGEETLSDVDVRWDGRSVKTDGAGKYLIRRLPAGPIEIWVDPISLPPGFEPVGRVPLNLTVEPVTREINLPVRRSLPMSAIDAVDPAVREGMQ
jgi:hypothetical protein